MKSFKSRGHGGKNSKSNPWCQTESLVQRKDNPIKKRSQVLSVPGCKWRLHSLVPYQLVDSLLQLIVSSLTGSPEWGSLQSSLDSTFNPLPKLRTSNFELILFPSISFFQLPWTPNDFTIPKPGKVPPCYIFS